MAQHIGPGLAGNTQTITTSEAAIFPRTNYARSVILQNIDATNAVFIGGDSGLTTSNGFRLAAGESVSIDLPPFSIIHGVSAGSVEVRFLVFDGIQGF